MTRRPLIVANWKMQLTFAAATALASELRQKLQARAGTDADVLLAPSFPHLVPVRDLLAGSAIGLAAQDVFWEERGPFTGEVSGQSLKELGVTSVIVGHSERRALGESDAIIRQKFHAALSSGLQPIFCVGESMAERGSGRAELIVSQQLKAIIDNCDLEGKPFVVAYEPVWAIGTGDPIDPKEAHHMAKVIHQTLLDVLTSSVRRTVGVIYGGSVDAQNVVDYVDGTTLTGVLVGHESLDAQHFLGIVERLCSRT